MVMISKKKVYDLTERVVMTFVGVFAAFYLPVMLEADSLAELYDRNVANKATAAGVAASTVMLMGLFGFNVGDRKTASLIPNLKSENWELGKKPADSTAPKESPAPLGEDDFLENSEEDLEDNK